MEATLGLREVALARKQHLMLLFQTHNLWFSHIFVCNGHRSLPSDDNYALYRQKSVSRLTLSASRLTLSASLIAVPEESTFKLAAENAYKSPSIEPHTPVTLLDSTPLKSHPNKRRYFPASGASVMNASLQENPYSALISGEEAQEYISGPSEAVVLCFKCLELTGVSLRKCLKHASSVSEDDIVSLLKTLSSYGFQRSEIKSMLTKYPSLVKVKGSQIEQCFLYYSGLEFSRSVVTSLLFIRPALLACDLERASQVIDYLLSMGVKKEDLSSIIACRPHILEHDVAVLKSIVSALMKARLDQSEINRLIKRSPSVFTPVQVDIERSLSFWSNVGVEGKALYRAILRRPNLLSYNTATMLTTYKYLQWWFDPSDLTKLVSRFAELLSYDPQTKLKPLIDYFLELGLSEGEVARVILRRPQLMTCTLERLKRVAAFLKSLGMKDDMVGKVLITSPQVFTLNTEDKLKRGVEFFRSMGLKKQRDLEYVFARSAQLFCCSIEKNLQPTIKFFLDLGLEKGEVSAMIVAFPSMLGQSVELSLAPKYEYLVGEMKRTKKELIEFPQYFGYSLEKRIKPRHRSLSERGLHKSLPSMLACTECDFQKRYIESYSPLPPQIGAICEGDPTEQVFPKKHKLKRKKAVLPPAEVQADPIRPDPSHIASEQETLWMVGGSEVPIAKDRTDVMDEEWEFLNIIPQLQQSNLYPASFRKYYRSLTPCGKWIHAYKFDT